VIKGKVRYISPEGATGERVDGRSDLYSLGVVFTEMMTMAPFREAPNDMAMLLDIRQGKFDRSRIARLPGPLQRVIERALAPEPDDRYPDANAFREDLLRSVDDDSRPLSDAELKRFMATLYAEEIVADQETERRAEQLWRDQDLPPLTRTRDAAEARPAPSRAVIRSPSTCRACRESGCPRRAGWMSASRRSKAIFSRRRCRGCCSGCAFHARPASST
jgi:serine/threonine-protein kinase